MTTNILRGLLGSVLTLGFSAVAQAVIIVESEISLEIQASIDGVGGITSFPSDSQVGTINPLSAGGGVGIVTPDASIFAQAQASSTWGDAASGQVLFEDVGWSSENVSSGSATTHTGSDWIYTFIVEESGLFYYNWNISEDDATTDNFGLNGVNFFVNGVGADFLDLNTSGSDSFALVQGQQYSVQFRNQANIFGGIGTRTAYMDGTINWNIAEIPVPGTLMLLGLALTGLGLSRRR